MKVFIPCILSSFLLLLHITAAGSDILADSKWISFQKQQWKSNDSIRITAAQNSYFTSDHTMTFWGLLEVEDIETLAAHNHTQQIEFKQSWSKGDLSDTDWQYFEMFFARYLYNFQDHVINITEKAGVTGAMMFQCWTGCSSSLDDMESFTYRVAMNGEDLVALNIAEEVWVAGNAPYSQAIQRIMQSYRLTTVSIKNILIHQCHLLALSYLNVGKEAFAKKIQPQVYIIKKPQKSETEVICMVTGFYPKPINVSLWKENKMEDVMSTDTLPNGDGTYQIRVTASVNANDQGSVYCQVEHSSLKSPLIVYQDKTHHNLIGMSIGIMAAIAVCVVGMTFLVKSYKKRRRYRSLTAFPMDRLQEQEQWLNCARQEKNLTQVHSNTNIL